MDSQESELIDLENACLDLVSERKNETFVEELLTKRQSGEWHLVHRLCQESGTPPVAGLAEAAHVFVTWLNDPLGDPSFATILFFDDESKRTAGAQYNRARLLRSDSPSSLDNGRRETSPTH